LDRVNGNISIHTENIFPIIKKWLYSDKDIFARELISNGCDAISKFKRLVSIGEARVEDGAKYKVSVVLNKDEKTIKFIDNGIGMTEDEIKKYINQVAFSGAQDFIAKYKDRMDEASDIIGHFGLGFYSCFMVSEKVEIDTLSYASGAEAVKWSSADGMEFEMSPSELKERGTKITLHIDGESSEFLDEFKLREIITKHCQFLPINIYVENEAENKQEEDKEKEPLNDTQPLWLKAPKDCTDEEYKEFYRKVFMDFNEPLFWIHLNVDYPFNLKGILYFPKLKHELDASEGKVKLYNNQVFVADNIKEIIPEFLLLLKGCVDCSDLPLNVSRSFLQKDSNVMKISRHITKKVADKLIELFKNERDKYDAYWDDINPFIKYGCMRDEKFYEQVKDIIIFKTIEGKYITLEQYLDNAKDKQDKKIFYVSDEEQQAQYINLFREHELQAVILNSAIDNHFISFLEYKAEGVKFNRIDSDLSETLKASDEDTDKSSAEKEDENKKLIEIFKDVLGEKKVDIKVENLKSSELPAIMLISEQSRRMQEMSRMYGGFDMPGMLSGEETLIVNKNNDLIKTLTKMSSDESKKEDMSMICEHIYDLALMGHKSLGAEAMAKFIQRSNTILTRLAK
jgi:molecular chaperone HtpG